MSYNKVNDVSMSVLMEESGEDDLGSISEYEDAELITPVFVKEDPIISTKNKFGDPYFVTQVLVVWLLIVIVFFAVFGLFEGDFFGFGPSNGVVLFGVAINTWGRWVCVMLYNFVDMLIFEWATEVIRPFIINTIQDEKTESLPISKLKGLYIINAFEICGYIRFVISIRMVFTQMDFMIAVFLGNMVSQNLTMWNYMRNKSCKK